MSFILSLTSLIKDIFLIIYIYISLILNKPFKLNSYDLYNINAILLLLI